MSMENFKPLGKKYLPHLLSKEASKLQLCIIENQENKNPTFKSLQKVAKGVFEGKLCFSIFNSNKREFKSYSNKSGERK